MLNVAFTESLVFTEMVQNNNIKKTHKNRFSDYWQEFYVDLAASFLRAVLSSRMKIQAG